MDADLEKEVEVEQDDFSTLFNADKSEDDEQEEAEVEEGEEEEQDEEQEKDDSEGSEEEEDASQKAVSAFLHTKMKQKYKGKIQKREEELARLREENAALKSSKPVVEIELPETPPTRPSRGDFDSEEAYDKAYEDWDEKRIAYVVAKNSQQVAKKKTQERFATRVKEAVEDHYSRVAELSEKSKISAEVLKAADATFRGTVSAIYPKGGDAISDHIIAMLGRGSEKVVPYIGRNAAVKNEFQSLLLEDKDGLKASVFLGRLLEKLNGSQKAKSSAPKPAASAKGGIKVSSNERALKKQYEEAHKKGQNQKAFNIKKQARDLKINVSAW